MFRIFVQLSSSFFFILLLVVVPDSYGQDRCGVVEYEKLRKLNNPKHESEVQFENWLQSAMDSKQLMASRFTDTDTLIIPVVVHVIHNGEAVGAGANISVAQILSQIKVLNQDYRRLNADTSKTPSIFKPVAADPKIEFRLAKRDPEGLASTGIVRVRGTKSSWAIAEYQEMKSLSYWPAEDYLNIWVGVLAGNLIGYAQLPFSDLPGIVEPSNNRLTDGVVISYKAFGSSDEGNFTELKAPYNKGRTATHEIGHFLGLRHIWGDGDCQTDDYCEDTPRANKEFTGCPANPYVCNNINMVQNYLDYTDDVCMNIFTKCQRTRMRTVLANSPRRKSLLTSKGASPPEIIMNDAGIREVKSPTNSLCGSPAIPLVTIKNYGSNKINSIKIDLFVNQKLVSSSFKNISLNPLATTDIDFSSVELTDPGAYTFTFTISQVNGVTDQNNSNNSLSQNLIIPNKGTLPVSLTFNTLPSDWLILNPDDATTWAIKNAGGNGTNNKALSMDFYNYENGQGELDYFISPSFDFTNIALAEMSFKVAYSYYNSDSEGLTVSVSTDCGNTFAPGGIFKQLGRELSTSSAGNNSFNPTSPSEWKTVTLDLTPYAGNKNVQVAFIAQNAFGNNLYIDDIKITGRERSMVDIGVFSIKSPSVVSCEYNPRQQIVIINKGIMGISSFDIDYTIDSLNFYTYQYNGEEIASGDTILINLPSVELEDGPHFLDVFLKNPNNTQDQYINDNSFKHEFIIDATVALAPFKENFNAENIVSSKWNSVNPDRKIGWEITTTTEPLQNNAAFIENFGSGEVNTKDWLVSPLINIEYLSNPQLNFKYSYAYNRNFVEALHVIVSPDCGVTYPDTIFSRSGRDLAVIDQTVPWSPTDTVQWLQTSINLSKYIGNKNIRLAFAFTGNGGNNLYLDDISLASSNNAFNKNKLKVLYLLDQPDLFLVTFNPQEREDITLTITDALGKIIFREAYIDTFSESHEVDLKGNKPGVYLLIATSETFRAAEKIILLR